MKTWSIFLTIFFLNYGFPSQAQEQNDSIVINNIAEDALLRSPAYDNLKILCKQIGHRLSGSPQKEKANKWGIEILKAAGADSVWLQPVMVPVWQRGSEYMKVKAKNGSWETLKMISLGNSEGTQGKELIAPIVVFQTLEALQSATEQNIKGKIVFLNAAFPQKYITTFEAYGASFMNRYSSPNLASEKGAIAFIMRSLSTGVDDAPHTGVMAY
ncbi:MAG TPA: hypothetical protein PKX92_13280 [Edaphocola sp.]|nr:hypothetical protein [Edaphocola sp.]